MTVEPEDFMKTPRGHWTLKGSQYFSFNPVDPWGEACLDGDFTAEDLRRLADHMDKYQEKKK
jgi:hypothetical protein